MHPLGRYLIPLGIILLATAFLWWALAPIIHYLAPMWPLLAIIIAIGVLIWRIPISQIKAALDTIGKIPLFRGLAITVLFTMVYGVALWLGYQLGANQLQKELGISQRQAWLIITVLGLPVIPLLWRLYGATGIPGDPAVIGRGFKTLALLILIFFGWWYREQPNQFFSHKTGEAKFWVAEKEGAIYSSEGYSLVTGEKLRLGKPEDVERFRRDSWLEDLEKKGKALFQPNSALQSQEVDVEKELKVLKFTLKPGEEKECIIPADREEASARGKINCLIPLGYWARIHSSDDVRMESWDGRKLKGRHWLGNEITDAHFTLSSFEKNKDAIVKIILRPK